MTTDAPARQAKAPPAAVFEKQLELGAAYLRRGNYQLAKDKLNRALEINPKSGQALTTLGLLLQLEGAHQQAEQRFKAALRHEPRLAQARNNYGVFLMAQQRYEEAVTQLKAAAEDSAYPNQAFALENLGRAYLRLERKAAAEQAFRKATRLNPAQSPALLELAELMYSGHAYQEAAGLLQRHAQLAPETAQSLWLCIRLSRALQRGEEETTCAQALSNAFPASPEYERYRGTL